MSKDYKDYIDQLAEENHVESHRSKRYSNSKSNSNKVETKKKTPSKKKNIEDTKKIKITEQKEKINEEIEEAEKRIEEIEKKKKQKEEIRKKEEEIRILEEKIKNKKSERKLKGIFVVILYILVFIFIAVLTIIVCKIIFNKDKNDDKKDDTTVEILDIYKSNNNVVIELTNDGMCSLDKENWISSVDKKCEFINTFILDKIYTKNKNDEIIEKEVKIDYSYVEKFKVSKDKIILAVDGKEKIDYGLIIKGNIDKKVTFESEDENIATVDNEGIITGVGDGKTTIKVKFNNKEETINVMVSDLIVPMPDTFDYEKSYLDCDMYTEQENDELDQILEYRVEEAGYKTRAGAVAVSRFIGLEFPHLINYFSENGRYPGVDGEGRYYHKGLYLNKSRYENLSNTSHGPGVWGCYIYSIPAEKDIKNGFDCSGFISWILKNAGFSPGDIGAGISPGIDDLTDLGTLIETKKAVTNNSIKVGDLLSGDGVPDVNPINGGHIAMVTGIKDDKYYVSEELWWGTGYVGNVIREYTKEELVSYFYWQIDMDEFYGEDGNLTDYWS